MARFFLILILTSFTITPALGQTPDQRLPWFQFEDTILGEIEGVSDSYTLIDGVLCHYDTLENLFCLDYGWHKSCLGIFAALYLSVDSPNVFAENNMPVLRVAGFNKIDFNGLFQLDESYQQLIPRTYDEEHLVWRVQIGSMETLLNAEEGIIHHLFNGEDMSIFTKLQNGEIMRSRVTLKGLPPLLLAVLEKAMEVKPEGQCSG